MENDRKLYYGPYANILLDFCASVEGKICRLLSRSHIPLLLKFNLAVQRAMVRWKQIIESYTGR